MFSSQILLSENNLKTSVLEHMRSIVADRPDNGSCPYGTAIRRQKKCCLLLHVALTGANPSSTSGYSTNDLKVDLSKRAAAAAAVAVACGCCLKVIHAQHVRLTHVG